MRVPYAPTIMLLAFVSGPGLMSAYGQRGPKMATLSATGTVKGVRPRVLLVTVGAQDWLITVPENYQDLVYEASATSRWLQPGFPVRFNATVVLEKRKREVVVQDPVTELTIAPVAPNVRMDLYPEQVNDQRESLFSRRTPEVKKKSSRGAPLELPCLVIGKLVEKRDGKLRVSAGSFSVRLELDPKAEIAVQWHDVRWVRPGDKIDFVARYPEGRRGQAQGQTMTVTAAKGLDVEEKAVGSRRKSTREGKSGDSKQGEKRSLAP